MEALIFIPALIPLAVIGAIIFGIYVWRRRDQGSEPNSSGIGAPRRIYFYFISFTGLMMLSSGVMIVMMSLLDELFGEPLLQGSTTRLASGLALTIVGLPLWVFHWRFVQRATASLPIERSSILRKLYLYVTTGVALGFLALYGFEVIEFLLQVTDFSGLAWATLPIWGLVWYYHWRTASAEGPETTLETRGIRRLYLYVASTVAVAILAVGLGWLVSIVLQEGYSAAFGASVIGSGNAGLWREAARSSLSAAIVGGVIWWAHWFRFAWTDRHSTLRWISLLVTAVGFGAIPALVGAGIGLNALFVWVLGASSDPAADHFRVLPAAVGTTAAGLGIWAYFRWRIRAEAVGADAVPVTRSYDLMLTAIGIAVLAAAAVAIIDTGLRLIAETSPIITRGDVQWKSQISFTLTLLMIGGPVWWFHWRRLQTAASASPTSERTALPRKIYVLGVLCLGVLALVGGASATLFVLLRDLLDAELSAGTLRDLASALAITLTSVLILPYHWTIYRQDRALEPDTDRQGQAPLSKRVTLLTAPGGMELVTAVENVLGYAVNPVHWSDPDAIVPILNQIELDRISAAVASTRGTHVLLMPEQDTLRVISYD